MCIICILFFNLSNILTILEKLAFRTVTLDAKLIAIFTAELSLLEDWHYNENADTTFATAMLL